jgi:pSer/pThr/pTyr-binding forkhead associated (FHA) protein
MAKLYLKFDQNVLKEFTLSQGVISIGRLPDNLVQIDNLAVSGHHSRIFWDTDHYVIEDNNSLNGTYVNRQRVSRAVLKDGDQILIGKHTVEFKDEWHEEGPTPATQPDVAMPALPKMQETLVLDTKKAKEMMAQARAAAAGGAAPVPVPPAPGEATAPTVPAAAEPAAPPRERTGVLTVLEGKTNESVYQLSGKLTVIGKSDMATIKLKGWFAPKVAAQVTKRDNKYFVSSGDGSHKLTVNSEHIAGQKELNEGDVIEVAGVKFSFTYAD